MQKRKACNTSSRSFELSANTNKTQTSVQLPPHCALAHFAEASSAEAVLLASLRYA